MPVLRELITVMGFDVDDAEAAQAQKIFDGLKKGALAVVAGVTAATVALGALIAATVSAGDTAAKTGKRLGITAEEVQELAFAAERSGVPIAQLNQGLRSLQRRAADSIGQNNEFAKGFAALGVRVTDTNGKLKPTVQLLGEVATAFQDISDEGERTALAMKVAGDGGASLLPLFLEGAKGIDALRQRARVLGFVLDNETAEAAERLADNFTDLKLLSTGVGRRIATQLLPVVERITNSTIDWFIANRDLIDRGVNKLVDVVEGAIDAAKRFARIIDENRVVLLIMAGVLVASVVPALLSVAASYAFVQLAAIKAAIVAAAPFLAVIALAALIALAIEDVFVFASGGESAIGNLFEAFTKAATEPGAHWMVQVLAAIIEAVVDTISAIDDFFKVFFDQSVAAGGLFDGFVNTLKLAWEGFVLFFKDQAVAAFNFVAKKARELVATIPLSDTLLELAGPGSLLGDLFGGAQRTAAAGGPLASVGGPSVSPPLLPGAGGTALQATFGGASIDVKIDGAGGDPNAIADKVAARVEGVIQAQNAEALRELESRVKR